MDWSGFGDPYDRFMREGAKEEFRGAFVPHCTLGDQIARSRRTSKSL